MGATPDRAATTCPAPSTDFIFAALGETYGFVGAALVLSLYALLIWRALRILMMAKNLYGTVIAGGILAMLMFQIFVNVGMTLGIMPITGVPLPLMSYGGSSVLVTLSRWAFYSRSMSRRGWRPPERAGRCSSMTDNAQPDGAAGTEPRRPAQTGRAGRLPGQRGHIAKG